MVGKVRSGREDTTGPMAGRRWSATTAQSTTAESARGSEGRAVLDFQPVLSAPCRPNRQRGIPIGRSIARMRRYELMLIIRPDVPDDRSQALVDRTTRQIVTARGQIVEVAPWGRRRLAYQIDRHREGSYHIILFEAPAEAIADLERTLLITEEVLRHLVTRVERPVKAGRTEGADGEDLDEEDIPPGLEDQDDDETGEFIDESESEAAPAAID